MGFCALVVDLLLLPIIMIIAVIMLDSESIRLFLVSAHTIVPHACPLLTRWIVNFDGH